MSETSETTMMLIWRRPVAKIDVYKLVFVAADGHRAEFDVPDGDSTYLLRNLNPGMLYTITLTAQRGRKTSVPVSVQASTGQCCSTSTASPRSVLPDASLNLFPLKMKRNTGHERLYQSRPQARVLLYGICMLCNFIKHMAAETTRAGLSLKRAEFEI